MPVKGKDTGVAMCTWEVLPHDEHKRNFTFNFPILEYYF